MRRSALPVLIIACVIVAAVLAWMVAKRVLAPGPAGEPTGPVVTESRTPGSFTKVDISGHADVELVQGPRHEVTVETPPEQQSRVKTRVEGGTLLISSGGARVGWRPFHGEAQRAPRIVVTAPSLEAIAAAGAIKISARSLEAPALRIAASGATVVRIDQLNADSLRFAGSGAVKAELAGKVTDLAISLSGAGDIRAPQLASENAKVTVAGAGRVIVNAEKTLRVSLSGAGSVEYLGNPDLKQSVSGIGRVKRREGGGEPTRTRFQIAQGQSRNPITPL